MGLGELMVALDKDVVQVTRFIRKMHGGSQPILVEASDGVLYVLKFINSSQGSNLLFNESMGTELYKSCKLPVPPWKPVLLTSRFIARNPGCWAETENGARQPEAKLCFGSQFLGQSGHKSLEILPRTSHQRIENLADFWLAWLLDICFEHADNRQAVFTEAGGKNLLAWFIDMGNMFRGEAGDRRVNFCIPRYFDSRIYTDIKSKDDFGFWDTIHRLDGEALWQRVRLLPADWISATGLGAFANGLDLFLDSRRVGRILDAMIGEQKRRNEADREKMRRAAAIRPAILCDSIFPKSTVGSGAA